jgi:hypothetical protein
MNPEIINLYIDRLLQEIQELIKNKLMIETQLRYTELLNKQLQTKITELESQLEKLNKKKQKEVITSNQF